MPGAVKTAHHSKLAKVVSKSVLSKPQRAASIIATAITHNLKNFPMKSDSDMQKHVIFVAQDIEGASNITNLTAQIKAVKMPPPPNPYKQIKGKYGAVSADLLEQFCNQVKNATPEKVADACNKAAGPRGQSGVKELEGAGKFIAELKLTGDGKRLYAKTKKGSCYVFTEMGKHT